MQKFVPGTPVKFLPGSFLYGAEGVVRSQGATYDNMCFVTLTKKPIQKPYIELNPPFVQYSDLAENFSLAQKELRKKVAWEDCEWEPTQFHIAVAERFLSYMKKGSKQP